MAILELDLQNAPPRQGGGVTLVPPGPYILQVVNADVGSSTKGNSMVRVDFQVAEGPYFGEEFSDFFAPVPPPPGGSMNGLSKLHALLLACGFKISGSKVKLDLTKLINRKCTANVATEQMSANDRYPEARDVSKIRSYELPSVVTSPASSNGNAQAAAPVAVAAPAPAAAPAAAETAVPTLEATAPEGDGLSVDNSSGDDLFS